MPKPKKQEGKVKALPVTVYYHFGIKRKAVRINRRRCAFELPE